MNSLAQTGTAQLLDQLSPFINDGLILRLLSEPTGAGRPRAFSSAQLLRVLLLVLLSPAHSFNLLLALLPEQKSWRRFAHLHNRRDIPTAKMLHQFRDRLPLSVLRILNNQLALSLLDRLDPARPTLAIMDSTDLPAAANVFKKKLPTAPPSMQPWVPGP